MIGLVRAAILCATLALGLSSALAADKAFKRDDLADSAIKLEAQIKSEGGAVSKSSATLKSDADAAFRRNDLRSGLQILGQIATVTPEDSGNWLRLARTIFQIRPSTTSEETFFMERASTAAYIAYQRAGNPQDEADALAVLGRALSERKLWRPALGQLPPVARPARGRRHPRPGMEASASSKVFDWSITASIPIPRRPARASSSPRTSPSASISRPSWRWPATTSRR